MGTRGAMDIRVGTGVTGRVNKGRRFNDREATSGSKNRDNNDNINSMKRIILLIIGIITAGIAMGQVNGNFKSLRIMNSDSTHGVIPGTMYRGSDLILRWVDEAGVIHKFFKIGSGDFWKTTGTTTLTGNVTINGGSTRSISFLNPTTFDISPTTSMSINLPSSATGDTYYRNGSGLFTRRAVGTANQFMTVSGGLPVWSTPAATTLNMSTSRLLGRTTASTGAVEEITVGAGLSLSGGSLTTTSTAGDFWKTTGTSTFTGNVIIDGGATRTLTFNNMSALNMIIDNAIAISSSVSTTTIEGAGGSSIITLGTSALISTSTGQDINLLSDGDVNITSTTGNSILNSASGIVEITADHGDVGITANDTGSITLTSENNITNSAVGSISFSTNGSVRKTIEPDGSWNIGGSNGTSGQVITSAGSAAPPTWQTISATSPITFSSNVISTSMATNRLIGRSTASTGVMEEISVGTGLSLSAGTLSSTVAGISGLTAGRVTLSASATTLSDDADLTFSGNTLSTDIIQLDNGDDQVVIDGDSFIQTHTGTSNFLNILAADGVASQNNGNSIILQAGDAYTGSGNGAGGNLNINPGEKNGSGTAGNLQVNLSSGGFYIIVGLPTTCAGAPTGALANIAGVLNVCP